MFFILRDFENNFDPFVQTCVWEGILKNFKQVILLFNVILKSYLKMKSLINIIPYYFQYEFHLTKWELGTGFFEVRYNFLVGFKLIFAEESSKSDKFVLYRLTSQRSPSQSYIPQYLLRISKNK